MVKELNDEGKEVEVEKEILVDDVLPGPWFTHGFTKAYYAGILRKDDIGAAFDEAMTGHNGAPIWSKQGLTNPNPKVVRRMNDGDVLYFDPNDPECPPDTRKYDAAWFTKGVYEMNLKMWRERTGNPDGLWPGIDKPWGSPGGVSQRLKRWNDLSVKSEFNAFPFTKRYWLELKYKIGENMDNKFVKKEWEQKKLKTAA